MKISSRSLGPVAGLVWLLIGAAPAWAQPDRPALVSLDFADTEIAEFIETIGRATGRRFIYDDRVRGLVTVVSPDPVPVEQAYAVFESVLQIKGFTTVATPGGAIAIVPIREAPGSAIETLQSGGRPPNRDRFITRLIPLRFARADAISELLKPLLSTEAVMNAYAPTNTIILTEAASNIRRLVAILESIDIEASREDIFILPVEHADVDVLAQHISGIRGAEVTSSTPTNRARGQGRSPQRANRASNTASNRGAPQPAGPRVRIITDARTHSLIVVSPSQESDAIRRLVAKLDVPILGGGRFHLYPLKNAQADALAETLQQLLDGREAPTEGQTPGESTPRAAVAGLASDIGVTPDVATNSLIVRSDIESFQALSRVIDSLDAERPQVSVEVLVLDVILSESEDLGFAGLLEGTRGDSNYSIASATTAGVGGADAGTGVANSAPLAGRLFRDTRELGGNGFPTTGSAIDAILALAATDDRAEIVSAPHILTTDNDEAEIRVGDNIPIVSSRVQSIGGIDFDPNDPNRQPAQSVNIERQDIGVTLRVTPRITSADEVRLDVFAELTSVNNALDVGDSDDVGVALSTRRIESSTLVANGSTLTIGGVSVQSEEYTETKVPWLGDIPFLGWLFKSTTTTPVRQHLLIFLTPRIIRSPDDLKRETDRLREAFERDVAIQEASASELEYFIVIPVPDTDETPATLLQELVEDGFDGTLVTRSDGYRVVSQLRVGPYATRSDARRAERAIRKEHRMSTAVVTELLDGEAPTDDGEGSP